MGEMVKSSFGERWGIGRGLKMKDGIGRDLKWQCRGPTLHVWFETMERCLESVRMS